MITLKHTKNIFGLGFSSLKNVKFEQSAIEFERKKFTMKN